MSEEVRYDIISGATNHSAITAHQAASCGCKSGSAVLRPPEGGVDSAAKMLGDLEVWMKRHGFEDIEAFESLPRSTRRTVPSGFEVNTSKRCEAQRM